MKKCFSIIDVFFLTQLAFVCSKLTIETIEQGMNMIKVNIKDTRTTASWLLTLNIFHTLFQYVHC